jgi:Rrf2 family nitric oxide-sensitive transcriptional repressor
MKVVHHRGKSGWVHTVRGKGGGLALAKPAAAISVGLVVRGAEGLALPAQCFAPEQSNCAIVSCCGLKGALGEAVNAFYAVLDRYTLADITQNPAQLSSILRLHRPDALATAE